MESWLNDTFSIRQFLTPIMGGDAHPSMVKDDWYAREATSYKAKINGR